MKVLLTLFLFLGTLYVQAQDGCDIKVNHQNLQIVDYEKVKCLAMNSQKSNTIVYKFGIWCQPCIYHLPQALALEQEYDVDVYVLIIDPENTQFITRALVFFKEFDAEYQQKTKLLLLEDVEGKKSRSKKYKLFLAQITPSHFENINDMSKYIVLNKKGETVLVTNYKHSKQDVDWTDDRPMLKRLVIPLLQERK